MRQWLFPAGASQNTAASAGEEGLLGVRRSISDPASVSGPSSQDEQSRGRSSSLKDKTGLLDEGLETTSSSLTKTPGFWQSREEHQPGPQPSSRGLPVEVIDENVLLYSIPALDLLPALCPPKRCWRKMVLATWLLQKCTILSLLALVTRHLLMFSRSLHA